MNSKQAFTWFKEQCSDEALGRIQELSNDLTVKHSKFKAPDLAQCFKEFKHGIKAYGDYQISGKEKSPGYTDSMFISTIEEKTRTKVSSLKEIPYKEAVTLITEFLEQIAEVEDIVNRVGGTFMEYSVEATSIGTLQRISEKYLDILCEGMLPVIEHLQKASGYTSNKRLEKLKHIKRDQTPDHFIV